MSSTMGQSGGIFFNLISAGFIPMAELFQIRCPFCQSKLNVKASLAGQTRTCPKCKKPIEIKLPSDDSPLTTLDAAGQEILLTSALQDSVKVPQLEFHNRYFILGIDRLVAYWDCNKGWQVNLGTGFGLARSNMAAIPDQGIFAFVEVIMESGIPQRLQMSRISNRAALTTLFRDSHAILGQLEGPTELTVPQKDVFLRHLRQVFMSTVLDEANDVMAYLMTR